MAELEIPRAGGDEEDPEQEEEEVKSKPTLLAAPQEMEVVGGNEAMVDKGVEDLHNQKSVEDTLEQELETSTTVLLRGCGHREEAGPPNGRPGSFLLSSGAQGPLKEVLRVSGKACQVTLEEDRISWSPLKAKEGERERERERLTCLGPVWFPSVFTYLEKS